MIQLEEINPDNWRLGLKVSKEQEKYVANDPGMFARAYAYREYRSKAFVIYNDKTPIGMAMYYDCDELNAYDFSQLFTDERYQGNGYGCLVVTQIINMMKKVYLCYIDGNEAAKKLYEKIGFRHTGESNGDGVLKKKQVNKFLFIESIRKICTILKNICN